MPRRCRQLDHTADIKVEIYGADLANLFENAAFCIFDLILEHRSRSEARSISVSLASGDTDELFLDWLRELLYRFSQDSLVVTRVEFERIDEKSLSARLFGETYDANRHGLKVELKDPTYHEYRLEKTKSGWTASVIFDA